MVLDKLDFSCSSNTPRFGIRLDMINKATDRVMNFQEVQQLLPFFKYSGFDFIELGCLNSFDYQTKRNTSIFAKEPRIIPPEYLQKYLPNFGKSLPIIEAREELYKFLAGGKGVFLPNVVKFDRTHSFWLRDFTCYIALSEHIGSSMFNKWPEGVRAHDRKAVEVLRYQLADRMLVENILQFLADKACHEFIESAHEHGLYVSTDLETICDVHSSETWGKRPLFYFNSEYLPTVYIGLPPSKSLARGEKTKNVPYRWQELYNDHFEFFRKLFEFYGSMFDYIHVLHGYSFFNYWEIARIESDPKYGRWVPIKSDLFFEYVRAHLNKIPYIFDFNEPLLPKLELQLKRRSLTESVIIGEPRSHSHPGYDLSRSIQMICTPLCDTKVAITDSKRASILEKASDNIQSVVNDEISLKVLHFDELCAVLGVNFTELVHQPQQYGKHAKEILGKTKKLLAIKSTDIQTKQSFFSKIVNFLQKS